VHLSRRSPPSPSHTSKARGLKFGIHILHIDGSKVVGSGWISHSWLGSEFGKFPLNHQIFQFFPFGSKKSLLVGSESTPVEGGSASYLLQVKSKLGSSRVRAHLYSKVTHQFLIFYLEAEIFILCSKFYIYIFNSSHIILKLEKSLINKIFFQTFN